MKGRCESHLRVGGEIQFNHERTCRVDNAMLIPANNMSYVSTWGVHRGRVNPSDSEQSNDTCDSRQLLVGHSHIVHNISDIVAAEAINVFQLQLPGGPQIVSSACTHARDSAS